jgi:hypothetical protein
MALPSYFNIAIGNRQSQELLQGKELQVQATIFTM